MPGLTACSNQSSLNSLAVVTKTHEIPEKKKLLFIKEIGFTHMRIADGVGTQLQLSGLIARLSQVFLSCSHRVLSCAQC
mgnify:CR=1 FL=1